MTDLRAELRRKWQEAVGTGRAGYEWRGVALDVAGPVRFVAAVREPDERTALLLEAPLKAAPVVSYRFTADGISVTDQRRAAEGLFRVAIVLEDNGNDQVFEVLAADVVEVAARSSTPGAAIVGAMRRLETWRACFKARRLGLSMESRLGLAGELIVLRVLAEELGYSAAVDAWQGPMNGLHDFSRRGTAIEVKTVLGAGNWLQISRFSQLDSTGLFALAIARPRLQEGANGTSLTESIRELRAAILAAEPAILAEFNERIMRAGYLEIDAPMYETFRFLLHDLRWFGVSAEFPRLTAANVPTGIVDGTYMIDERSILQFRLESAGVRELMQSMKEALHA
jgi:hypothetical protein